MKHNHFYLPKMLVICTIKIDGMEQIIRILSLPSTKLKLLYFSNMICVSYLCTYGSYRVLDIDNIW